MALSDKNNQELSEKTQILIESVEMMINFLIETTKTSQVSVIEDDFFIIEARNAVLGAKNALNRLDSKTEKLNFTE
jgi:hypothetical protein